MQAAGQGVQIALQDSDLHALSCSLRPISSSPALSFYMCIPEEYPQQFLACGRPYSLDGFQSKAAGSSVGRERACSQRGRPLLALYIEVFIIQTLSI